MLYNAWRTQHISLHCPCQRNKHSALRHSRTTCLCTVANPRHTFAMLATPASVSAANLGPVESNDHANSIATKELHPDHSLHPCLGWPSNNRAGATRSVRALRPTSAVMRSYMWRTNTQTLTSRNIKSWWAQATQAALPTAQSEEATQATQAALPTAQAEEATAQPEEAVQHLLGSWLCGLLRQHWYGTGVSFPRTSPSEKA